MRNIVLPQAFQDFNNWAREDKKVYGKIVSLIDDILQKQCERLKAQCLQP